MLEWLDPKGGERILYLACGGGQKERIYHANLKLEMQGIPSLQEIKD
jgi:hypothetical protein